MINCDNTIKFGKIGLKLLDAISTKMLLTHSFTGGN